MQSALFCLNGPNEVNGPNVWLTRHLPLLKDYRIDAKILYLSDEPEKECRFRKQLIRAGVPCRSLRLKHFLEDNIESIVEAVGADLPVFFMPNYSVPAYFASRFIRSNGVLTVGTLHSDDPYYHDIIDYFVTGPAKWRLSAVVGVSDYLTTLAGEKIDGLIPYLHAPYGAPIPTSASQTRGSTFRLVYCGRLVERQKRIRRVALAMVAAAQANARVEGVLYGDGPEAEWLRVKLTGNNCGHRVRLGGLIPPERIRSILGTAQAFVLLSDFEGLSIALMEAMACGLVPIVSHMRSGANDLIEDGVNGFLIDGDDVNAFASLISRLADEPDRWRQMSIAARKTIKDRDLTSTACARKWAGFLKDLNAMQQSRNPLNLPPRESWDLPLRSNRPHGTRSIERRCALPALRAALKAGRPVFLWGAGLAGERFVFSAGRISRRIAGFIDSDTSKFGNQLLTLRIFPPSHLENLILHEQRPYVLITSQFVDEIELSLQEYGLCEDEDYSVA